MNIYIIHTDFSKRAGTERALYNLIKGLLQNNNIDNITLIVCSNNKELVFDVGNLPIDIKFLNIDFSAKGRFQLINQYYNVLIKLFIFFKTNPFKFKKNILISSNHYIGLCSYLSSKRYKNFKHIVCEHFSFKAAGFFSKMLRKLYFRYITVVTLTHTDLLLIKETLYPKKILCIPNSLPFTTDLEYNSESKNILSIGRLSYEKGFDLLLSAFKLISHKYPNWKLNIVGDDYGEEINLVNYIKLHNLHNVHLHRSTEHIKEYYANSAFYVLSSRSEGLPMVLLESLAFKLPIVSFDCPTGPKDVVSNLNGILVDNGDVFKLANSMEKLIINKDLRESLSGGSVVKSDEFKPNRINRMWDDLINNL